MLFKPYLKDKLNSSQISVERKFSRYLICLAAQKTNFKYKISSFIVCKNNIKKLMNSWSKF